MPFHGQLRGSLFGMVGNCRQRGFFVLQEACRVGPSCVPLELRDEVPNMLDVGSAAICRRRLTAFDEPLTSTAARPLLCCHCLPKFCAP